MGNGNYDLLGRRSIGHIQCKYIHNDPHKILASTASH